MAGCHPYGTLFVAGHRGPGPRDVGRLVVLDAHSGDPLWTFDAGTGFRAPVVGSAVILIGAFWVSLERGPVDPTEDIPWAIFANLGLVGLFLIGVVVGSTLAGSAAAGLVEQESATAPPATFEAKYTAMEDSGTRGVLTIRHAGGDRIPRDW